MKQIIQQVNNVRKNLALAINDAQFSLMELSRHVANADETLKDVVDTLQVYVMDEKDVEKKIFFEKIIEKLKGCEYEKSEETTNLPKLPI